MPIDVPIDVACHLNVLVPDLAEPALSGALGTLAELGYSTVVLPPFDPESAPLEVWARTFRDHGLTPVPIAGQAPGADVSSADPLDRERGVATLRRMVEATVALGGDQLNGVPYGLFGRAGQAPSRETFERAAAAVGSVADHAHDRGVRMTFEVLNRYETALVNTARQAVDLVAASGSEHLRVHLDTFHMAVEETDLLEAIRSTVPLLGYLELGQSGRGPLGSGVVDAGAAVRAALEAGYRGRIGVEAFSSSVLPAEACGALAIWRDTYADGRALAAEAIDVVRRAEASVPVGSVA